MEIVKSEPGNGYLKGILKIINKECICIFFRPAYVLKIRSLGKIEMDKEYKYNLIIKKLKMKIKTG